MNPEIHPDNNNFTWSVPGGPYHYLSKNQVDHFDEQGFLVIENAFDREYMRSISNLIDPFEEKVTEILRGFDEGKVFISRAEEITFSTHLVTQNEDLKEFSKNSVFSSICLDLIGNDVRLYWDQAVYKKPVVVGDQIVIKPIMNMGITFDHRIIDGSEAGKFMQSVKDGIELIDSIS